MATHNTIIVQSQGQAAVTESPMPALPDDYVLVKTKAVSLNPTDWKHLDLEACTGTVMGCDYAGVVVAIGPAVKKSWRKGDRIAGFVHGCDTLNPQGGAFAEYVIAKGDLQMRIPDFMSFEAASTLGVGIITVGQNLYQSLDLQIPGEHDAHDNKESTDHQAGSILIYGGATATGSLAIKFAKLSGMHVITTCSEINRTFMYEWGADVVFDYHDTHIGDIIRQETDDSLEIVFDTISTTESASICAAAISSAGGVYNALHDIRCPRPDVDTHVSMAYDIIGEDYWLGGRKIAGNSKNLEFGVEWVQTVEQLLQSRHIHPHPYDVKPDGLIGIPNGLQLLRQGKIHACKLVYQLEHAD
ncbi:oxidoreductase [Penicillium vulpinum]|uniref:oxidoreductase n=1 Tax=Penicillium vulpinum TaxID=29845 RepID=UPI0025473CB0|nr:oxidoreductase [Penicillium vulpinum]KAJ5960842.1 oxidoreductase [Penicillium vulpinum]